MRSAAEKIARGVLDPSLFYTHSFHLDEFPDALDALEQRPGRIPEGLDSYECLILNFFHGLNWHERFKFQNGGW